MAAVHPITNYDKVKNITHDCYRGVKSRDKHSYTVVTVLNAENGCSHFQVWLLHVMQRFQPYWQGIQIFTENTNPMIILNLPKKSNKNQHPSNNLSKHFIIVEFLIWHHCAAPSPSKHLQPGKRFHLPAIDSAEIQQEGNDKVGSDGDRKRRTKQLERSTRWGLRG